MNIDQYLRYLKGFKIDLGKDGDSNTFKGKGNYSFIEYGQFCQTEQKILLQLKKPIDLEYFKKLKKTHEALKVGNGIESLVRNDGRDGNIESATIPLNKYNPTK